MIAKAKLTIVLKADETVVAEIENPDLWQRVLAIVNRGDSDTPADLGDQKSKPDRENDLNNNAGDDSVAKFAKQLGVTTAELNGALSPTVDAPYLHLDSHNWEAFKRNFPKRGPGSVSPIGLAGTALALWAKVANLDIQATQALASSILDAIGARDPNPSRGIKNTKWLQARASGTIIVNPAEISKAQGIVRAFCIRKSSGTES